MQSNYSDGKLSAARGRAAVGPSRNRKKKKGSGIADERQKTDCENLRIPTPFAGRSEGERREPSIFKREIYDGRWRKLNTDPGNL